MSTIKVIAFFSASASFYPCSNLSLSRDSRVRGLMHSVLVKEQGETKKACLSCFFLAFFLLLKHIYRRRREDIILLVSTYISGE